MESPVRSKGLALDTLSGCRCRARYSNCSAAPGNGPQVLCASRALRRRLSSRSSVLCRYSEVFAPGLALRSTGGDTPAEPTTAMACITIFAKRSPLMARAMSPILRRNVVDSLTVAVVSCDMSTVDTWPEEHACVCEAPNLRSSIGQDLKLKGVIWILCWQC